MARLLKDWNNKMMKRARGRNRRPQHPANRAYDSNGPDVRVRGTAAQVYEKYQTLARDAASSGDRIMAENYQQHGEHYYRIMMNQQAQQQEAAKNKEESEEAVNGAAEAVSEEAGEDTPEEKAPTPARRRGPLKKTESKAAPKKTKAAKEEATE